jgi:ferredoxin--NADP+ reductase
LHEKGERFPLTVAGKNLEKGTIKIIFQTVGKSTTELGNLKEGDFIRDIVGPLGKPTEIENFGTVVAMAGGVGTAELLPVISDLLKAGNKVITIVGAKSKLNGTFNCNRRRFLRNKRFCYQRFGGCNKKRKS